MEKTIKSKYIYQGKVISLRKDKVILPNGRETDREIVEHSGAVAVVPINEKGQIVLVKQYRKPIEQETIEIPAGKLNNGENPEKCALRELQEEIGYTAEKLVYKFSYYTTPGFSNEKMHLFFAWNLKESKKPCDDDEFIEITQVSLQEALHMIIKGKIIDGKTITGILALLQEEKISDISPCGNDN